MNIENEVESHVLVRTLPRMKNMSKISEAVLSFENMKFVAGRGEKRKVILHGVSATISSGRKFSLYQCDLLLNFFPKAYLLLQNFLDVLAIMGPSGRYNNSSKIPLQCYIIQ
jgi:hypothetical protein